MDTDFVGYGTPVVQIGEDESLSKFANENKLKAQKVRDKQGRERFHGAFTGGFSAGYYNTVGTEEGWTPSAFTSSRYKKSSDEKKSHKQVSSDYKKPEHFMDEEDLELFGIAPRQVQTSQNYRQGDQKSERAAWDPIVPGMTEALADAIKPVHISIAVKLLQFMGWKHGQGIGPRVKRKHKHHSNANKQKVIGPSLSAQSENAESSDEDSYMSNITFAPKDRNPVNFDAKDDLHGIGYQSLSIKVKSKSSTVEEERLTFGGHTRGISGKAFGVGIEEDDDDADIYVKDQMSNYDMSLGDEPEDLHTFTKPSDKRAGGHQSNNFPSAAVLEGFCLAKKKDHSSEKYVIPELPRGYRPKAAITGVSELPKLYGKMDKTLRALIIGESIRDAGLITSDKLIETPSPLLPGKSAELSLNEVKPTPNQEYQDEAPLPPPRSAEPLNRQSVDFKPFSKHPEKQARYERYLMLRRTGDRDAYDKVAPAESRKHERDREREEFNRSGKFFKDLSSVMASRFTRSKQKEEDDDSKVSVRVDEEMDGLLDDKKQAVQMKMFGNLTRESYEWHPHRLLCRRFNIPDPYPNSRLVGLPTVYKDKISAYNFLDIDSLTKTPTELKAQNEKYDAAAREAESEREVKIDQSTTGPKSLVDGEKAPIDLFKAVFQDSDSDQSESSADEESEGDESATNQIPPSQGKESNVKTAYQSLQEQYGQSRTMATIYNDNPNISQPHQSSTSSSQTTDTSEFKVKFVPKKDRYKSATKMKKSRWADETHIDDTHIDDTHIDEVVTELQEDTEQASKPSAIPEAITSSLSDTPPVGDEVLQREPGTPPTPDIHTPSTASDDDSWMPALPPAFINTTSASALAAEEQPASMAEEQPAPSKHKKSKAKNKYKHKKKSKSKKSHKEHKAR